MTPPCSFSSRVGPCACRRGRRPVKIVRTPGSPRSSSPNRRQAVTESGPESCAKGRMIRAMGRARPLVCELHSHTTWSDGELSVPELVDLYGRAGFDVLAVTDHVRRGPLDGCRSVRADNFEVYLGEIEDEAERAWWSYGMLVLPGI